MESVEKSSSPRSRSDADAPPHRRFLRREPTPTTKPPPSPSPSNSDFARAHCSRSDAQPDLRLDVTTVSKLDEPKQLFAEPPLLPWNRAQKVFDEMSVRNVVTLMASLGLKINATRALGLPVRCHSHVNLTVSDCPGLLHISPSSPEAKVFRDFENNAKNSTTSAAHGPAVAKGWLFLLEDQGVRVFDHNVTLLYAKARSKVETEDHEMGDSQYTNALRFTCTEHGMGRKRKEFENCPVELRAKQVRRISDCVNHPGFEVLNASSSEDDMES